MIALLLLAAAPVQAPVAVIPVALPAPSAAALHIAMRLASEEVVIAQTRRVLHRQLPAAMAGNTDVQAMERLSPGITAELVATMEPIIVASLVRRLPAYQRDVGSIFDRHMTAPELTQVGTFYDSPTGAHILTLIREGIDFTALLDRQIRARGEATISDADLTAAIGPAVQPAVSSLSDAEQLTLMRFGMSAAGRKMSSINGELLQVAVQFNNQKDEATEKELDAAMRAVVERRLAARKAK